ncbi:sugar lactone lactonase YvrE [Novosphingobium chloroacetimidivorans]|uniref:Sugar lactone lactonase YvrE n=1 Tax=Novosphingobium chloroacetimidivorans TaxID=1428314 RepID=A0A7W7NXV9_9SPHN|nr:SMP-30/gluconolactonase/LRE family protein [Novosphingobium chloroacetimidivorans]MBB4860796.1 sugar lactone lactonase YvrE [Novosphingobium chloroacetimidivorans]
MSPTCVADAKALLGEGPLWDENRQVLWWIDIKNACLHRFEPDGCTDVAIELDRRVTAMALGKNDELYAVGDVGFGRLDPTSGRFLPETPAPGEPLGNRFNDGKADQRGRFWAGTMDDAELEATGAIYCFEAGGGVERVADGFRVPNGPAFDSLGRLYLADSALRTIYRYPADKPGSPDARSVFATFLEEHGYPDGMTFDHEDHLWVAFWHGWCVRRLSPDGEIVDEVPLPVQRPTSCAFGGPGHKTLYVTSASVGLNHMALHAQPQAGGLFAFTPACGGMPTDQISL